MSRSCAILCQRASSGAGGGREMCAKEKSRKASLKKMRRATASPPTFPCTRKSSCASYFLTAFHSCCFSVSWGRGLFHNCSEHGFSCSSHIQSFAFSNQLIYLHMCRRNKTSPCQDSSHGNQYRQLAADVGVKLSALLKRLRRNDMTVTRSSHLSSEEAEIAVIEFDRLPK